MHHVLAETILEQVRKRFAEGDCPITEKPGREAVEFALIEIARQRDEILTKTASLGTPG